MLWPTISESLGRFLKTKQTNKQNQIPGSPENPLSQNIFSEARVYVLIDFLDDLYAH